MQKHAEILLEGSDLWVLALQGLRDIIHGGLVGFEKINEINSSI